MLDTISTIIGGVMLLYMVAGFLITAWDCAVSVVEEILRGNHE